MSGEQVDGARPRDRANSIRSLAGSAPGAALLRMRWWDVEDVAELDGRLFGADAWTPEFFWSQLAAPGTRLTLALSADTDAVAPAVMGAGANRPPILGFVGVGVSGPQADILTIGTAPEAQGRGLGRLLLAHASAQAREAGAQVLHLDVADGNEAALKLYRSAGFAELGRRPGYYAGADAILMRAFL